MSIVIDENKRTALEAIFPVSIAETECSHRIKPVVIFNCMQDLAARSINHYDYRYGCEGLAEEGRGWYIIRYRVEFDDYPLDVKELKIRTESRGVQRMTAFRDFEVFDNSTGKRILKAASSWFVVDLESKSVINIQQEYPEFLRYEKREDDLTLAKLKSVEDFDNEKIFHVRYDDLDINNHVNNTVYINWALEALDYEFRSSHSLKTLDIYFKHEVKYGDDIVSKVRIDKENLVTEHVILNAATAEEVCLLRAEHVTN